MIPWVPIFLNIQCLHVISSKIYEYNYCFKEKMKASKKQPNNTEENYRHMTIGC